MMQKTIARAAVLMGLSCAPNVARANWGEYWGEMLWNGTPNVPILPGGWAVLAVALLLAAGFIRLRSRRHGVALVLALCAVPLLARAGTLEIPNVFTNGTVADANDVNDNFNAVAVESDAQDARIAALETALAALQAQVAANGSDVGSLQVQVAANGSDVAALQTQVAANGSGLASNSLIIQQHAVDIGQASVAIGNVGATANATVAMLAGVSRVGDDLFFDGMNVHVRNALGSTTTQNGRGNLIVGYNADPGYTRTGSHNLIVGDDHEYTSWGGVAFGSGNVISGEWASVLGGFSNVASGFAATVIGGGSNQAIGNGSMVLGGAANRADGIQGMVLGGGLNEASGQWAVAVGGYDNEATQNSATVVGGFGNSAAGFRSTVAGGTSNQALGSTSSVFGGEINAASGETATILGGKNNAASALLGVIAGGENNISSFQNGAVFGGAANTAGGLGSTVVGGFYGQANGTNSLVAGGQQNLATGDASMVAGGIFSEANGNYAVTTGNVIQPAGTDRVTLGDCATEACLRLIPTQGLLEAGNTGAFSPLFLGTPGYMTRVKGDLQSGLQNNTNTIFTQQLIVTSDHEQKQDVAAIDSRQILERVAALPIQEWRYRSAPDERHVGPMAQDFRAAFDLGHDDKGIATVDADGIALAAIQGLYELVETQRAELELLRREIEASR